MDVAPPGEKCAIRLFACRDCCAEAGGRRTKGRGWIFPVPLLPVVRDVRSQIAQSELDTDSIAFREFLSKTSRDADPSGGRDVPHRGQDGPARER